MNDIYYVNGEFVPSEQAMISVRDLFVLRGYGVFDFMRTYHRRPFHLDEHLARLENSARLIGLELRWSREELKQAVLETIARNPHLQEANVRIVVSGGTSSDGINPEGNAVLMVMATPPPALPAWWYRDGVKVITNPVERYLPGAKSTGYLNAVMAMKQAGKNGAVEALYVDRHGRVLEGATTNFFAFRNGRLITPGEDILLGVTRKVVLDLVKPELAVEIRDIYQRELNGFEETFISSSNKEILPVVQIDDLKIGSGGPGPLTRKVMRLFRDHTDACK